MPLLPTTLALYSIKKPPQCLHPWHVHGVKIIIFFAARVKMWTWCACNMHSVWFTNSYDYFLCKVLLKASCLIQFHYNLLPDTDHNIWTGPEHFYFVGRRTVTDQILPRLKIHSGCNSCFTVPANEVDLWLLILYVAKVSNLLHLLHFIVSAYTDFKLYPFSTAAAVAKLNATWHPARLQIASFLI